MYTHVYVHIHIRTNTHPHKITRIHICILRRISAQIHTRVYSTFFISQFLSDIQ